MVLFLFYELPYFCINAEKLFVNLFIELKPMRIFFLGLISLFITSCVDIFDDITIHADGSGTYKYTINMSASKVKINSILALDSLDDHRVPKIPEIKEKIRVCTPEDLVILKMIARRRIDYADIEGVLKYNWENLDLEYMKKWFQFWELQVHFKEEFEKDFPELSELWS